MKPLRWDKQEPAEFMSRRTAQLPDRSTTRVLGQELVAWLPFWKHSGLGIVLGVCAPVSLESYPPPCLHVCIGSSVLLHGTCRRRIDLSVVWWTITWEQLISQWRVCLLRCSGPWRNSNDLRPGWRHVPEPLSLAPRWHQWLEVTFTCHDPAVCYLPAVGWNVLPPQFHL